MFETKINKTKEIIKIYYKRISAYNKKINYNNKMLFKKKLELIRLGLKQKNNLKTLRHLPIFQIKIEVPNHINNYYNVEFYDAKKGELNRHSFYDVSREDLHDKLMRKHLNTEFCILMRVFTEPSADYVVNDITNSSHMIYTTLEEFMNFYYGDGEIKAFKSMF